LDPRWIALALPLFGGQVVAAPGWRAQLEPMFEAHCFKCHDADEKKGGLDLGGLPWNPADAANQQLWTKILDQVEKDEMPPKRKPRPPAELREDYLKALRGALHQDSMERQNRDGRVVFRRLNRAEYANTLHDLLGTDTALQGLLPQDPTAGGFDNIGAALNLSTEHLERYLQAADRALKAATVTTPAPTRAKIRIDYSETWHDWNHGFQTGAWAVSPEGFLAIYWGGSGPPHGTLRAWSPPVPDERYRFRVRARAMITKDGHLAKPADQSRPDRNIMLKLALTGESPSSATYGEEFHEMSPSEFGEFTYEATVPEKHTLYVAPHRIVPETAGEKPMERGLCAVVEWVEIEGPLYETWPPAGHRLLYGDLRLVPENAAEPGKNLRPYSEQPEADAARLLRGFLGRVFRRPATDQEVADHLALFREQQHAGRRFDESLRAAYKMALCSPAFLFLQEKSGRLDDFALATRLSLALWSSAPDEELLILAANGGLSNPATLRAQTERLLASPKARRFTQTFLGGWLNLREIDFTQPDTKLYPEFEPYLQQSMLRESEAFFETLLRNNLSVRNVVHSDFAMLNERLAEHYGIAGVKGDHIRRVPLPADSHRGGFITQGAVLKVSANGTSTSPVVRGAYVLDRILGSPPGPPPKDVPALEPDIRGATTIREQLAKHRDQPACAGCHAKLDPPGFALENFDVTGRWRTSYRTIPEKAKDAIVKIPGTDIRHYIDGPEVDPSYTLPDGRSFSDIDAFKQLLLAHPEQIAHCVVEKLIAHLTGATVQFADREVVREIISRTRTGDFGLRDLVHEVIQSRLFLNK
jgi:hypothetical protein